MNENKCPRCGALLAADSPEGLCPRCLMALNLATQTEESTSRGTRSAPPSIAEIAKHFPQFEILEILGRGGMGVVYKARQPKLDRIIALKILAHDPAKAPQFAERFQREARALARLNHPNIVAVHDFGETAGFYYLVMEFVDGVNLREMLRNRKLAPTEALAIVPSICDALQFAHQQGIVHRDIKPENILIDKQGRVKIADFGIAKILGTERSNALTGEQQSIGTPHYMAPEQVEKPATVDHRADIYSLGVVFYEMLTGELPLGRFSPPSQKVQMDIRLDEVVMRTLEKEPERRYQQVGQVKTQVETIAATPASGGSAPPPLQSMKQEGAGEHGARLSKSAIVGLVFIPAFLIFGLAFVEVRVARPEGSPPSFTWVQIALKIGVLVVGFSAPFITTICGWLAISQIRRSRGRLYGLGLALFEGVFFPLLVFNFLILLYAGGYFSLEIVRDLLRHMGFRESFVVMSYVPYSTFGLILAGGFLANVAAIRVLWQKIRIEKGPRLRTLPRWSWAVASILFMVALTYGFGHHRSLTLSRRMAIEADMEMEQHAARIRNEELRKQEESKRTEESTRNEFDKVFGGYLTNSSTDVQTGTDQTLQGINEVRTNCFFDLDTGKVIDPPSSLNMTNRQAVFDWCKETGVDVVADTTEQVRGLLGYDLTVTHANATNWNKPDLKAIYQAMANAHWADIRFGSQPLSQAVVTVNTLSTYTPSFYVFRTREGGFGFLKFLEYDDAPNGSVKFRYKLVTQE